MGNATKTLPNHPDNVFTDKSAAPTITRQPQGLMASLEDLALSLDVPVVVGTKPDIDHVTQALIVAHDKLMALRDALNAQAAKQRETAIAQAREAARLEDERKRIAAFDTLTGKLIAFEPKQEAPKRSWWR